jgi:predicted cupin superfamily sugar epimerase
VRSEELWLYHAGDSLRLCMASPDGATTQDVLLGSDTDAQLQAAVPAGWWQSAEPLTGEHGYALVGCIVAPGFDFEDFQIAEVR